MVGGNPHKHKENIQSPHTYIHTEREREREREREILGRPGLELTTEHRTISNSHYTKLDTLTVDRSDSKYKFPSYLFVPGAAAVIFFLE